MRRRRVWGLAFGVVWMTCWVSIAEGGEPLHERIDRLIEAGQEGRLAAPATDGEFLRRVTLDLTGMIPTAREARAFLDDPSPYKRARLIDRLLASPEYARRLAIVFDVMLMERRPDLHVPGKLWDDYLRRSFAENKPLNQLVSEILSADGSDPSQQGPAKFYLDREGDPYQITRDVGRLFLGRDMQCAQCHDHVLIDDYKQAHYYGLYAFFSRSYLVPGSGEPALGEKAEGEVTFASVFKKKVTHKTGPRLLDGPEVPEPEVAQGNEYIVAPVNNARAIPRYSRRAQLVPLLTLGQSADFNRNLVNRLWAIMMGRGLVHPLDMHHSDNPPSHPELLDLLAQEFVAMGFDVRAFLRELALTRTYARSSEPPPDLSPGDLDASRFNVAALKPLSPEQFCWSLMQATGLVASTREQVERQLLGADPKFRDLIATDAKRREFGRRLVEETVFDRLAGNMNPFIHQFSRAAGQVQDASDSTVHQALFLANGQPLQGWLAPSEPLLVGRLVKLSDSSALAEELYLAILTRRPTPDEREEVSKYLAQRGSERTQAIQELAWALLTSVEFRFNH
jgi:hypothetical protein